MLSVLEFKFSFVSDEKIDGEKSMDIWSLVWRISKLELLFLELGFPSAENADDGIDIDDDIDETELVNEKRKSEYVILFSSFSRFIKMQETI